MLPTAPTETLPAPSCPVTVRYPVAVIGDVHGEARKLDGLLTILGREAPDHTIVFLGDFVDRGPDPKAVVERVVGLVAAGRATAVAGNHDYALVRATGLDGRPASPWWRERYRARYDATTTLDSYTGRRSWYGSFFRDLDETAALMPEAHRRFLGGLPWLVTTPVQFEDGGCPFGGHLFLHCGLSRRLAIDARTQIGCLRRKHWDAGWCLRSAGLLCGVDFVAALDDRRTNWAEYPAWLGADRDAALDPLPCPEWCQVIGHDSVDEPRVLGGGHAVRIDTLANRRGQLTACILDDCLTPPRFLQYPK